MDKKKLATELYFAKEAAEYLGISMQRLNILVKEGKIEPLKKTTSGTIFYITDLEKRKKEQEIFTKVYEGGTDAMFKFDTKEKKEALNFATLMNVMRETEHSLEPKFEELSRYIDVTIPLSDNAVIDKYVEHFGATKLRLCEEYEKAYQAFLTLREDDEIIKRGSEDYPPLLAETEQAPRFLYIRGKKSLLFEKRTVSLVGSRQASENAKENTRMLTRILGKNGITVVSGLAKGIDVSGHMEALRCGFNTIAVIGTNINQYYPKENESVQREIEKRGLVVSQFSPANKTERWFFPLRNGVMSGLSLATIIMEAGETSGALKQADFALKQGRQIMIPRNALNLPNVTWPAKYVEKGAEVVDSPMDVLRKLADNNIFKVKKNVPVQQTLEDYLRNESHQTTLTKTESDNATVDWPDPVFAGEN